MQHARKNVGEKKMHYVSNYFAKRRWCILTRVNLTVCATTAWFTWQSLPAIRCFAFKLHDGSVFGFLDSRVEKVTVPPSSHSQSFVFSTTSSFGSAMQWILIRKIFYYVGKLNFG